MYQLFRGLGYLHSLGIAHRDIKPCNILIHFDPRKLKLCDFGSAKQLVEGEKNHYEICTLWYRAPELLLKSKDYTTQIGR